MEEEGIVASQLLYAKSHKRSERQTDSEQEQ